LAQKTLLSGSGIVPLVSFDTAKLKIYFDTNIISSINLIIFKNCPASVPPAGLTSNSLLNFSIYGYIHQKRGQR